MLPTLRVDKFAVRDFCLAAIGSFAHLSFRSLVNDGLWGEYFVMSALFVLMFAQSKRHDVFDIVLFVAGLVLYIVPYFGLILRGETGDLLFLSLFLWVLFICRLFFRGGDLESSGLRSDTVLPVSTTYLILALCFFILGEIVWMPVMAASFAISMFLLDRTLGSSRVGRGQVYLQLLLAYVAILIYAVFIWDRFGRLHFLLFLMAPALLAHRRGWLNIKLWHIFLIAPMGIAYGQFVRGAERLSFDTLAQGSSSHHLLLQEELLGARTTLGSNVSELINQFALLFLNWFPRDVWEGKPYGVGWTFVDSYLGRSGYSDQHSISLGLWGEHIYLNPNLWLLSGIFSLLVIGFLGKCIARMSGCGVVLLLYQLSILSFLWGGMASFGSRVWWLVIPLILYQWAFKVFGGNSHNCVANVGRDRSRRRPKS